MTSIAEKRIESLCERHKTGALHHGLILRSENLQFVEDSAVKLYKEILKVPEGINEHPDLFHLRPSGKARIITVERTRELIDLLNRTGHQSSNKVAIIHEVDRMRKEAANAFLKTLEEPPKGTYLLLLTTRPYAILPTILSRCLVVRLDQINRKQKDPEWENWLTDYEIWINLLLNRKALNKDRSTPVFMAYGLLGNLVALLKRIADEKTKESLSAMSSTLEDKEKDAFESGLRRGIRTGMLKEISEYTRNLVTDSEKEIPNPEIHGIKLGRVIQKLEKITGLLEVNLKEESALEEFMLSSLRIWSSK